jgi:hypothetical protein
VSFENGPIGPTASEWTVTSNNNFIVPANGYYQISYKIDAKAGTGRPDYVATVLTQNGTEIPGSCTLNKTHEPNTMYELSNTILVNLVAGDSVSLLVWAANDTLVVGNPPGVAGKLPNGSTPTKATATIVFSRVY